MESLYVSPGVQFGLGNIGNGENKFLGVQLTVGYKAGDSGGAGISLGHRWFIRHPASNYSYTDLQVGIAVGMIGLGTGYVWRDKKITGVRYKAWGGMFGLLTLDKYVPNNEFIERDNHITNLLLGVAVVLPLPFGEWASLNN